MQHLLAQLVELETELHHHSILCPVERLHALLHPQFHEIGQSGNPYSRETVINYLSGCTEAPPTRSFHHALQPLGPRQALLTYLSALTDATGQTAYTWRSSIWINDNENWQLLYHQGTPASVASIETLRTQGKLSE
ncbi:MAG: DUF4440 domain-containing protein [Neisseria sp.]|uniref:nuclear transport factor 2 family protein n=1 Tax=Neisseria sp. TaxID=192066 RepID=UPI0026DD4A7F|nr:DUF4440 domain-containing protein [Neisseria sp.]MDO4641660.1 DUF4440 domain-containing protein [Neisseria sp.]